MAASLRVARKPSPGGGAAQRPSDAPAAHDAAAQAPRYAVLALMRYRPGSLLWGLSRLVLGAWAIDRSAGLRFVRVLGSGRDGGFGLSPGWRYQGLMAFFDEEAQARHFAAQSTAVRDRLARSEQSLLAVLCATSARGSWAGVSLQAGTEADTGAPIAVLTRASIRPRQAATFWRHSPGSERALSRAPGCQLAVGLGEAPVLRQATFSLWDNAAAIDAYARHGAHGHAARRAWEDGWFSEWMFVRFRILSMQGSWQGRNHG